MSHRNLKLLLSARDPGSANNMIHVAKTALDTDKFEIIFYADEPAYSMVHGEGLQVEKFHAEMVLSKDDAGVQELHNEAIQIIKKVQPDVVVAGISGPGAGIDEALLVNSQGIPSYAIQDFRGRVNNLLGENKATYFVIDDEAALLSYKHHKVKTIVTGLPKYAEYKKVDSVSVRNRLRNALCHKPDDRIITFIGQDHWHMEGYHKTLRKFAEAILHLNSSVSVYYRKHPKEPEDCMSQVCEIMSSVSVNCQAASEFTTEEWLVVSDIVCCVCSTTGVDQIMLNRLSKTPLGVVVYLFYEEDIINWYEDLLGKGFSSPARQGTAFCVEEPEQILHVLQKSLLLDTQQEQWLRIQESIPMPDLISTNILNIMHSSASDKVFSVSRI